MAFFSHCLKSSPKLLSRSRESFTPSKLAFRGLPRTQLMTNSTGWKLDILVQFRKWWIRLKGWLASKWKMPLFCLTCWAVYLSILFVCEFLQYGNVCHLSNKMGSKTTQMSPFRSCDLVSQKKKIQTLLWAALGATTKNLHTESQSQANLATECYSSAKGPASSIIRVRSHCIQTHLLALKQRHTGKNLGGVSI